MESKKLVFAKVKLNDKTKQAKQWEEIKDKIKQLEQLQIKE